MNKLVLAGMLLVFAGSLPVHAEMPDDCPCRHLNIKPKSAISIKKNKVSQHKPIINSVKASKPVAQTAAEPSVQAPAEVPPPVSIETPVRPEIPSIPVSSRVDIKQKLTPLYLGVSAGAHYGQLSNTSPKSTYHVAGRAFAGYKLNDNIAVELGYFMMKPESTSASSVKSDNQVTTKNKSDAKARRSGVDLVGLYKSTETLPGLYVKAGIAYDRLNDKKTTTTTVRGIPARDRTIYGHILNNGNKTTHVSASRLLKDNMDAVIGIGYETNLSQHLMINVDYTRYQPVKKNEVKTPINFFSIGTKYQF